jgi:putative phosphoserine phosphatase/1-acylglycerol-3-phosphate O-acyltransferase
VFVFNHQSKADVIIVSKLIRRDIAGIGKQEIKKETPILGMVLELGGVIFIDRGDAKSAIQSMSPLVDAMRKEGKSVVLAPEGTRTVSPKMAPFKKGAFHLAMQAGVPMVPIVIHNAGDVAPKGDFVFRSATVEVEVLPPVDTSDWRVETVAEHVREVRNMFARTLGQPEEKETTAKPKAKTKAKAKARTKSKPRAAVKKKTAAKRKAVAAKKPAAKKTAAKRKVAAKTKAGTAKKATVKPKPKTKTKAKPRAKAAPRAKARPKTKSKK